MFPCGLITISVRCRPSQEYDKKTMKTTHGVFLVPRIIPLMFVFLLGWTDVDVFHVNQTCLTFIV